MDQMVRFGTHLAITKGKYDKVINERDNLLVIVDRLERQRKNMLKDLEIKDSKVEYVG